MSNLVGFYDMEDDGFYFYTDATSVAFDKQGLFFPICWWTASPDQHRNIMGNSNGHGLTNCNGLTNCHGLMRLLYPQN